VALIEIEDSAPGKLLPIGNIRVGDQCGLGALSPGPASHLSLVRLIFDQFTIVSLQVRNILTKSATTSLPLTALTDASQISGQLAMITPGMLSASLASVLSARTPAQNATASDQHVGWVSSTSGRSTSDILWSCFSILLVCTYKCIHFNVPSRKESEAGWFTWTWWRKWLKKLGWIMLVVLAPELGVALAMDQYLLAREQCHNEAIRQTREKHKADETKVVEDEEKDVETATAEMMTEANMDKGEKQEITNTHTFFANMGGFNLRICALSLPQQDRGQEDRTLPDNISQAENTVAAVDKAVTAMQEIIFPLKDWNEFSKCTPNLPFELDSQGIDSYRTIFPDMSIPTEKEINDLSKADAFTKAFACIQSTWLIIQSIVRVSVGLPITQLELATMAFVLCALTMYLLWWRKPFGVESRNSLTVIAYTDSHKEAVTTQLSTRYDYLIGFSESPEPYFKAMLGVQSTGEPIQEASFGLFKTEKAEMDREFYQKDMTWDDCLKLFLEGIWDYSTIRLIGLGKALGIIVRNVFGNSDFAEPPRKQTRMLAFYATGVLFSALHLAAWNWEFPSPIARELWRIFAIIATGTGPATILLMSAAAALEAFDFYVPDAVVVFLMYFPVFVYAASRIGLVVLIFYCFSSMPAGVYKTVNWLQFLPHFS
jgi:hypothetical protein